MRTRSSKVFPSLVAACLLFFSAACTKPSTYEAFVTAENANAGMFNFYLDLSDSLSTFDVYLYTRVDRRQSSREFDPMEVKIWWVAPSGSVYDETVWMRTGDHRGVKQLYRKGIVPSEAGEWNLCLKPVDAPDSFRGIGVILENNGTR